MSKKDGSLSPGLGWAPAPMVRYGIVEQGVPIPEIERKRPKALVMAEQMQVGDSVLLAKPGTASALQAAARKLGFTTLRRSVDGGIRVWRTK